MKVGALYLGLACSFVLLSACASLAPGHMQQGAITLPYTISDSGHYVVNLILPDGHPHPFIIDTAATTTTISARTAENLDLSPSNQTVMVHGVFGSERRPTATLSRLTLGNVTLNNKEIVILQTPERGWGDNDLLGLDILSDYAMEFSNSDKLIHLYPRDEFSARRYKHWGRIDLIPDPLGKSRQDLLFAYAKIEGNAVPAVIDLGSSFSAVNWESFKKGRLRRLRGKMKDQWKLAGAIGKFTPFGIIKFDQITMNERSWENASLPVLDLKTEEIYGAVDQPLMIAGVNLFANHDYLIDMRGQAIYIKRQARHPENSVDHKTFGEFEPADR